MKAVSIVLEGLSKIMKIW